MRVPDTIAIELEAAGDSRSTFRLRVDSTVVGENLTAAQAQLLVGDILERIALYPAHPRSRKSLGEIIRKLSVTESQNSAHLLGTSSRRNSRVVSANSPQVP